VKIESTRTFATGADGGAVSREHAEQVEPSRMLPRTPPPRFFAAADLADAGARWLAATGVVDEAGASLANVGGEDAVGDARLKATVGADHVLEGRAVAAAAESLPVIDGFAP
jgi:hypothetical protein